MKLKSMNKENKTLLAVYIGWTFLHLIFLILGWNGGKGYHSMFWPFYKTRYYHSFENTISKAYDFSEFLVYVGTPAVIFIIYKLITDKD